MASSCLVNGSEHHSDQFSSPRDPKRKLTEEGILAFRNVKVLRTLVSLRSRSEQLDRHFEYKRRLSENPTDEAKNVWFEGMVRIMGELQKMAAFIPPSGPFEFLDIGCSPGGFTSYVLRSNPQARGVGISLPQAQGGHALTLDPGLMHDRFEYIERDLLGYNRSPHPTSGAGICLPPEFRKRFDLVILDAHPLWTYHSPDPAYDQHDHPERGDGRDGALLVVQFIIALASVRPGGTILTKLHKVAHAPSAQLLYLLDKISEKLVTHKPVAMNRTRGSFYAIAKGVGRGVERAGMQAGYLEGLQELWDELRFGGQDGGARRMWAEKDLEFVVTPEKILSTDSEGYLDRLIKLGKPVWASQAEALGSWSRRKGGW
ncbi:hypothetical protein C8Q77DRAFT_476386 [Trametes polyzona]|nr:hypothetical protein C8Q77DRAFT_476386 [Trametes polyzona]